MRRAADFITKILQKFPSHKNKGIIEITIGLFWGEEGYENPGPVIS
jgi:hypothetical protein